jgi:hypothetical protein
MRKKITFLTAAIILALGMAVSATMTACKKNAPSPETLDATAALRKLQAGTQVGINYQEYGKLLIEAKAKVNDATRSLPEGELKTQITGAMDSYADAATVWGVKIKDRDLFPDSEPGKTLITKYGLAVEKPSWGGDPRADSDKALQVVWLRADIYLNQIDILLKQTK